MYPIKFQEYVELLRIIQRMQKRINLMLLGDLLIVLYLIMRDVL